MSGISKLKKQFRGFTLIELLVAISITALLVAIGMAGFQEFANRQQVDILARAVLSDLRATQTNASSGIKTGCTNPFAGYKVDFNVNGKTSVAGGQTRATAYTISTLCPGSISPVTKNLSTNQFLLINRMPVTSANLTFKPLDAGTDVSSGNAFMITVSNTKTSRTIRITVTASGQIQTQ